MEELVSHFISSIPPHLRGGTAAAMGLKISQLRLRDGTELSLPGSGVTAFVGPNNAGKSTLLREIHTHFGLERGASGPTVRLLDSISVAPSGESRDAIAWLIEHGRAERVAGVPEVSLRPLHPDLVITPAWMAPFDEVWHSLPNDARLGRAFRAFFVHYLDTESRLEQSKSAPGREDARAAATHPLHALEDDRSRLAGASQMAEDAFSECLYLDDFSTSRRLKVGRLKIEAPPRDATDHAYRDALLALPDLSEQGDGMRSFFGQFLQLVARQYPIVMIDEPEAFLHPPQAYRLGKALGDLCAENSQQVLLATHDRDLLRGLVDSKASLSVVRLDRNHPGCLGSQLPEDELAEVWSDSAVRYSNALSGLFHKLVVLVEGDGDARFYGAALAEADSGTTGTLVPSDVLFVPCNGKGGMAKLAKALGRLGVPVVASPDLDVLKSEGELRALIAALGGDWTTLESLYRSAVSRVAVDAAPLKVGDLRGALPADDDSLVDEELFETVKRLMKTAGKSWDAVKRSGITAFGGGAAGKAVSDLLEDLDEVGLVAVREGELESFDLTLGASKSNWVAAALEAGVQRGPGPQRHVRRLIAAYGQQARSNAHAEASDADVPFGTCREATG